MNPNGSDWEKISDIEGGINGFSFSPDEKKVLFVKNVKTQPTAADQMCIRDREYLHRNQQ